MKITRAEIYRYSIPMRPFTIATTTVTSTPNILLYLHTDIGITGIGEGSTLANITGETQNMSMVLAHDFAELIIGRNPLDYVQIMEEFDQFVRGNGSVKIAFDLALLDIAAQYAQMPLYEYLGGHYFEPESDITIGIGPREKMVEEAQHHISHFNAKSLKIKVGKDAKNDVLTLEHIRDQIGPEIIIRIDANQGWDYEDAVYALSGVADIDIELCEQPMAKHLDYKMPSLRRICQIPVMADESVFDIYDVERITRILAFDFVNLKFSKTGSLAKLRAIHDLCGRSGMANMLGGMVESRVGLTAKVHFALSCPNIKYYDLDTCLLGHEFDPVVQGVQLNGLKLQVPKTPGIGVAVDPSFLAQCQKLTVG